jgi:hypothetical protein
MWAYATFISFTIFQAGTSLVSRSIATYWILFGFVIALSNQDIGLRALIPFPPQLLGLPAIIALLLATRTRRRLRTFVADALLAVTCLAAISALWSVDASSTVQSSLELLYLVVIIIVLRATVTETILLRSLSYTLAFVCLISLLTLSTDFALEQGRLRGVTDNANTLGAISAFAIVFSYRPARVETFQSAQFRAVRYSTVAIALFTLALTGSRASAVALVVSVPFLAMTHAAPKTRLVRGAVYSLVVLVGAVLAWSAAFETAGLAVNPHGSILIRADNTRAEVWAEAYAQFLASPFVGNGWSSEQLLGSSYLQLLRDVGILGVIIALSLFARAITITPYPTTWYTAVLASGATNCFFESWLFAGGSFFALAFWLSLARPPTRLKARPSPTALSSTYGATSP